MRDTVAEMAAKGLIARGRGHEHEVALPTPAHVKELLGSHMHSIDPAGLIEFRRGLEVLSAQLAARRRSDDHLASLAAIHQALIRSVETEDEEGFMRADLDFHRAIAEASGNVLTALVLDALVDLLWEVRRQTYRGHLKSGEGLEVVVQAHARVLEAIRAGLASEAATAMESHLEAVGRDLKAFQG